MQLAEWLAEWSGRMRRLAIHFIQPNGEMVPTAAASSTSHQHQHQQRERDQADSLLDETVSVTPPQSEGGWRVAGRAARLPRQMSLRLQDESCPMIVIDTHLAVQSVGNIKSWRMTRELKRRKSARVHENEATAIRLICVADSAALCNDWVHSSLICASVRLLVQLDVLLMAAS